MPETQEDCHLIDLILERNNLQDTEQEQFLNDLEEDTKGMQVVENIEQLLKTN